MQDSPLGAGLGKLPTWDAPTLQNFDLSNIEEGKRIGGSKRQYVRFYKRKSLEIRAKDVKVNERTGEVRVLNTEAVPVEQEFVEIITPGDKNSYNDKATDWHRREFWAHYKAFRDGKTAPLGKSIDECSYVSSNISTELLYLGVHTEEQLADASDYLCEQVPNGWELREFARASCKASMENENLREVNLLKVELEQTRGMLGKMQEQMAKYEGMLLDAKGKPVISESSKSEPIAAREHKSEEIIPRRRLGRPRKNQSTETIEEGPHEN